jgi:AmmeMemoRadiSam system protein B
LGAELDRLLADVEAVPEPGPCVASAERKDRPVRGVVSPHIDFERGGPSYATTWKAAGQAARDADLVVMLGTDHQGESGSITLTRQHYATPYGKLPTSVDLVDRIADALGEHACFDGELNHRSEHSVELSAVWLHHMREGAPVEFLPVLCGSYAGYLDDPDGPEADATIERFVAAMEPVLSDREVLVVASADLSHVGPAFGGEPVDGLERAKLRLSDSRLIAPVLQGDAEGFFGAIRSIGDRTHICGVPPIYLLLRLMAGARGELVAYDTCPADERDTSLVSVCGILLR